MLPGAGLRPEKVRRRGCGCDSGLSGARPRGGCARRRADHSARRRNPIAVLGACSVPSPRSAPSVAYRRSVGGHQRLCAPPTDFRGRKSPLAPLLLSAG